MTENNATNMDQFELVITHTFDAKQELVFKAWTTSEDLKQWWGPKGFTMSISKSDLRPGGVFHYSQKSPDGHEMWGKLLFREIVAPTKLVFINSFSDEEGNTIHAPFSPTWPLEILNTLTFIEHEGKTTLTMRGVPLNGTDAENKTFKAAHEGIQQGVSGTFGQLADYLTKAHE
ncbi:SRPBCC domain-containing protein [Neobacillus sp. PS3-40]|uniref:SRPBCC family protein n=1 Tax=Neobacillus sp. PS3-40 TaxID=3070679 RepID=UPI0027E0A281|nr:SRPBCC domain-containing protein [Neobacillus sp. PS3-40]WML42984.1 SRPBCC domain-containing protein [Neobacillus sp. PS3-40]